VIRSGIQEKRSGSISLNIIENFTFFQRAYVEISFIEIVRTGE